jgi:hypothetical protein
LRYFGERDRFVREVGLELFGCRRLESHIDTKDIGLS